LIYRKIMAEEFVYTVFLKGFLLRTRPERVKDGRLMVLRRNLNDNEAVPIESAT
jgi:hypothetical protein